MKSASIKMMLGLTVAQGSASTNQPFANTASLAETYAVAQSNSGIRRDAALDSAPTLSRYKLSGERSLRPARVSDDGTHMYLEWAEDQALPAVFAVNTQGNEEMVDGYMRQGVFTIDRVHNHLVFRIDKKSARADRTKR